MKFSTSIFFKRLLPASARIVSGMLLLAPCARGQVFMTADGMTDTYALLTSKGYNYEVYDARHLAGAPHIRQQWDAQLKKFVFAFAMHRDSDLDPTDDAKTDRQRNEIKVDGHSPASMQIYLGDTETNRWKFKLDAAFQPSSKFTHIHQIKAGTGTGWTDTDNPIITFTARKGSPDKFELNYIPPGVSSSNTILLASVNLAPFKGSWVEVIERATYNNTSINGRASSYDVTITNVSTGEVLFTYSTEALELYRNTTIGYNRPKFGIYRSILDSTNLRNETLLFADFALVKGAAIALPAQPTNVAAAKSSQTRNDLSWEDAAADEDQFRIDRSADGGASWTYLASVPANMTSYADTGLVNPAQYAYRVRAENAQGNSAYSAVARPLPVEIKQLSAASRGLSVVLTWTTATETNSYGFEIERQSIGAKGAVLPWQKAGFVPGAGTTSTPHSYHFEDRNVAPGRYFYRLKQIDSDGVVNYSPSVEIEAGLAPKEFRIIGAWPNPFNPSVTIRFSFASDGEARLTVFDLEGKRVAQLFEGPVSSGVLYERAFSGAGCASGVYLARLESAGRSETAKLLLMK